MCSILTGEKQKLSAKRVTKFAQQKLTHERFKTILQTDDFFKPLNTRTGSFRHQLQTIKTNKLSLSSFDDKRYVLEDGISPLPHGRYKIRDVHVGQIILVEPEWGYEDDEIRK